MSVLTKKHLIELIYNQSTLPHKEVLYLVDEMIEILSNAINLGQSISIRGFGGFSRKKRVGHFNINPKTGEKTYVTDRYLCHFSSYYKNIDST